MPPAPPAHSRRGALALGLAAVAGATGLGAALAGCSSGNDAVDQSARGEFRFVSAQRHGELIDAAKRRTAPKISGPDLDGGKTITLAAYRGKVLLLNWWASWCGPCRAEAPDIEAYYQQHRASGFTVLGVNTKDDPGTARSYVDVHKLTYPSIEDEPGRVAMAFRGLAVAQLPWSMLIDKQGRVAGVYTGGLVVSEDIAPAVTKLLRET
ncbi:MAG: TlpA family protein disulfide reductase [Mycobacteriales bacterium]